MVAGAGAHRPGLRRPGPAGAADGGHFAFGTEASVVMRSWISSPTIGT